jgi:hypothetical protein
MTAVGHATNDDFARSHSTSSRIVRVGCYARQTRSEEGLAVGAKRDAMVCLNERL